MEINLHARRIRCLNNTVPCIWREVSCLGLGYGLIVNEMALLVGEWGWFGAEQQVCVRYEGGVHSYSVCVCVWEGGRGGNNSGSQLPSPLPITFLPRIHGTTPSPTLPSLPSPESLFWFSCTVHHLLFNFLPVYSYELLSAVLYFTLLDFSSLSITSPSYTILAYH